MPLSEQQKKTYKTALKFLRQADTMLARLSEEQASRQVSERTAYAHQKLSESLAILEPLKEEINAPQTKQLSLEFE